MKISKYVFVGVIVLIMVVVGINAAGIFTPASGKYDDFAKCLSASGAKMYGAYWCSHCKAQKDAFGSSWQYMTYIECSTPDGSGQLQVCKQAGITAYPTWEFDNGTRVQGELTFMQLGQYTNCTV